MLLTKFNSTQLQTSTQTPTPLQRYTPSSNTPSFNNLLSASLPPHAQHDVQDAVKVVEDEIYSRAQSLKGLGVAINTIREKGLIGAIKYWFGSTPTSSEDDNGFCVPEKECLLLTIDSTKSELLDVIRQDMPKELVDLLGGEEEIVKLPILELAQRRGPTGYIDFVSKNDMGNNNVMWGRDIHGRLFVSFKRENNVITYFRRYSPLDGVSDIWVYGGSSDAGPNGINIHHLVKEAGLKSIKPEYSTSNCLEAYNKARMQGEYQDFANFVIDYQNEIESDFARNMLLTMMYGHKGETASSGKLQMAEILLTKFYDKMEDRTKTTLLHSAITAGNQPMYDIIAAHHESFKSKNPNIASYFADKTVALMREHPEFLDKFKENCRYEAQIEQMDLMKGDAYADFIVDADDVKIVEHIKICYESAESFDNNLAHLANCFNTARAYQLRTRMR